MKVLHLIGGGDTGGAKTHVLSLIKVLSTSIDVKLISFRHGPFTEEACSMGIDVEVVKTGFFLSDVAKVIDIIKKGSYQIIHCHGSKGNAFGVMAKLFTHLPVVTTVHSDYKLDYLQSLRKKLTFGMINAFALRFMDYYISVSESLKHTLVKRAFNPWKIFMLPNGIDFNKQYDDNIRKRSRQFISKKYNAHLEDHDTVVGILARLTPVKGLGTYLDAAREVLKNNPSVKFLIGGDGGERRSLESKARKLGISRSVFFLGHVDEPLEFMKSIDINVLTSISEGFPYVILEGAVFKRATVSSNVGGISDLVTHGQNGYLFNPKDYKKLADYLLELVSDSKKRQLMGEKIYQKACSLYSIDTMCQNQINVYDTILTRKSSRHKYDAILSGYYGYKNSGDDAILQAIISNLKRFKADIRIIVLSKNPNETKRVYGVESINRFNIFRVLSALKHSKLFINGGGNLLQDDTSTRSLMYYLGVTCLAKKMSCKVMVYANGIGPISRGFNRKITGKVLNQANFISLREELSKQELDSLGVHGPQISITADPALTVAASNGSEVDNIFEQEGINLGGKFIGFSVRSWDGFEKYARIIANAADYMVEKYGVIPVFIPMHYPNDLKATRIVISKMKHKGYMLKRQYNAANILGIISHMQILVGMRLHSLIYASSLGVPVVGLVYEPKVEASLKYFGQASAGHVNSLNMERFKEILDDVWARKNEIKSSLKKVMDSLKEKAYEDAKTAIELIESKSREDL